MKMFLIKIAALSLLVQPIIANPFIIQGMRSQQNMAVMRAVLNNQKQNAGIFNKNVQKRTVVITHEPGTTAVLSAIEVILCICTGGAIVIADKKKMGKYEEEFIRDELARIAQEKAKSLPHYQEPMAYNVPNWMQPEKKYPPGFVYGFETSDGLFSTPISTVPVNNIAPSQQPLLPLSVSSGDGKENAAADIASAVANSGKMAQRTSTAVKDLVQTINGAAVNNASTSNPICGPTDQGGGVTVSDVTTGAGVAVTAGTAADAATKTTTWSTIKTVMAPYVEPVVNGAAQAAKLGVELAKAHPVVTGIAGGAIVFGGGYKIYGWWTTPTGPKDSGCAVPATDPLAGITTHHPVPAVEIPKNTGCGSTMPEQMVLTPQEISDVKDQLVLEKNKAGDEKNRANNEPGAPRETGAQAPGIPREEDGYIPPKKGDGEKVKVQKGKYKGRYGWLDKKGSIWVPTGPNGHGCPHWDVQHPDGSYDNVVPGGGIRGEK